MSRVSFCLVLVLLCVLVPSPLIAGRGTDSAEDPVEVVDDPAQPGVERPVDSQGPAGSTGEFLLLPEPYYYESFGRRDLFVSLVSGEEGEPDPNDLPGSGDLQVVGILWGENDRFGLVETSDGRSLLLREGSRLGDGTVLQVLPDKVIVHVTKYGTSHTVTLPLMQGGSFHESPRSRSR
jgi:hypothetical protein